jgi:hypothetical protein
MLEAFGMARSLSKKGCPFDNAVDESTNKSLKAELAWGEEFGDLRDLQARCQTMSGGTTIRGCTRRSTT